MASFDVAFNWMMDNEDREREYACVADVGGHAISGINSAKFPEEFTAIYEMATASRGPAVQEFYLLNFWNVRFAQLTSDEVAKRVFDAAVNMGPETAVKLLQRAINDVIPADTGNHVATDGAWGPATLMAANIPHQDALVVAFIQQRKRHYQAIVAMKPELSEYLNSWLARAGK